MVNNNDIYNSIDNNTLKKLGIKPIVNNKLSIYEKRILDLFKDKDIRLSIIDIVLRYYNEYTKNNSKERLINRNYMGLIVYRMVKKKLLKAVSRGIYQLYDE